MSEINFENNGLPLPAFFFALLLIADPNREFEMFLLIIMAL